MLYLGHCTGTPEGCVSCCTSCEQVAYDFSESGDGLRALAGVDVSGGSTSITSSYDGLGDWAARYLVDPFFLSVDLSPLTDVESPCWVAQGVFGYGYDSTADDLSALSVTSTGSGVEISSSDVIVVSSQSGPDGPNEGPLYARINVTLAARFGARVVYVVIELTIEESNLSAVVWVYECWKPAW